MLEGLPLCREVAEEDRVGADGELGFVEDRVFGGEVLEGRRRNSGKWG